MLRIERLMEMAKVDAAKEGFDPRGGYVTMWIVGHRSPYAMPFEIWNEAQTAGFYAGQIAARAPHLREDDNG